MFESSLIKYIKEMIITVNKKIKSRPSRPEMGLNKNQSFLFHSSIVFFFFWEFIREKKLFEFQNKKKQN